MPAVKSLGLFPFCIWPDKQNYIDELLKDTVLTYDNLINTIETFKGSLDDVMAIYWRVKKWKAFGQFEYSIGANNFNVPFEFFLERDAKSEADLVCTDENGFVKQFICTGDTIKIETPDDRGTAEWAVQLFAPAYINEAPSTPRAVMAHKEYFSCGIEFATILQNGPDPDADSYSVSSVTRSYNAAQSNTTVPFKFLGETHQMLASTGNPPLGDSTLTLEAKEYWEYDPLDGGGPIYDKKTGQPRRGFP